MSDNEKQKILDAIAKTFDEIRDLVLNKSQNYGVGKIYETPRLVPSISSEAALLIRLNDKFNRFETLLRGERDRVGESIDDTARDMIGYIALWLTLRQLEAEKKRHESIDERLRDVAARAEFEAAVQYP